MADKPEAQPPFHSHIFQIVSQDQLEGFLEFLRLLGSGYRRHYRPDHWENIF